MGNTTGIKLLGNTAPPSHVLNLVPAVLTWGQKGRERMINRIKVSEKKFLKI